MTETIPEAKRHLHQAREAQQAKAVEFWQQTIQTGRATQQGHAAQTKIADHSDEPRQPRQT